jgi:AraC family transcriptional regulator, regulatory protein of adaptative response / methylated-DNA-[protein]-cysteine methyltransferase
MTQAAPLSAPPRPTVPADAAADGYHYNVMRRALEVIDRAEDPMQLDRIAAEMGMSAAHFQRLFSRWVGVSPKRYQQYLMMDHARTLMREKFTTLDTAHSLGLSGTGRLHDLFLRWEAMSPGEFARKGAGMSICWGRFHSPFGPALVMGTDRGICGLALSSETGEAAAMADLTGRWPLATFREDPDRLRPWVETAFGAQASATGEKAPVYLIGAPFQIKVWEALLRIPSGQVTTYSEIAEVIGSPRAVRAVGTAVGRNPVSWLIPCHRALRKSGGLGGYHWGLPVKRAMLAWESARAEA